MRRELIILAAALGLTACGDGSDSASPSSPANGNLAASLTGYALPTEISAVPAESGSTAASLAASLRALASAVAVADLPADSDYKKAVVKKYVEERTLEQFAIIETIFNALAQTRYAENVGQGPYKAMVAWEEKEQGRQTKVLQPWVVRSEMVQENGKDVNVVQAWVEEPDVNNPNQTRVIYAEFKIYSPAVQNADGSYEDYGEWDINAALGDTGWFTASARKQDGKTVLKISMEEQGGPQGAGTFAVKAIMHRGLASGYGKVQYPTFTCGDTPDSCTMSTKVAAYAYNADYLAVDDGSGNPVYKDRGSKTEFVQRYGLFFANADAARGIAAGDDVLRHKAFGFPFRYTDSASGHDLFGYYGAWQGRHQIWGGSSTLAPGTPVTREDVDPSKPAQTYYASPLFKGTLTKRTLVDASLDDIRGVPVEVFVSKSFEIAFDGSGWKTCPSGYYLDSEVSPPVCRGPSGSTTAPVAFTDFGLLVPDSTGRKFVQIIENGMGGGEPRQFVWNPSASRFEEAVEQNGQLVSTGTALTPAPGTTLMVNVGGSIYVAYTGDFSGGKTGWVQKKLASFDEEKWVPTFDPSGDQDFSPELGQEYYIFASGANYIVRRTQSADDPSSYSVQLELQSAANPKNAASFLPAGVAYLATPWNPVVRLKLDTDPASSSFMMLVYQADDPSTPGVETGQLYTGDTWGLQAYDSSGNVLQADGSFAAPNPMGFDANAVQFNWEYDAQGGWGSQQFLCKSQGCPTLDDYVILDDPIQLQPIQLANGAGKTKSFQLQYDGWLFGLPNPYEDLDKNGWKMTPEIAAKVVNVPDGTLVTGTDGTEYYLRPLEVSVFLNEVSAPAAGKSFPDLSQGQAVDLASVPTFDDPTARMGSMPDNATLKYSEGKPVS